LDTPISPDTPLSAEEVSEAILDVAQAIAKAAGSLLSASAMAQKERALRGDSQDSSSRYHADPTWANGLISAARYVVATTQHLVRCADERSRGGEMPEELLVASAQAVTAATAQLVAAQKAKADIQSDSHRSLIAAAKAVTDATAKLVEAVQPPEPEPQPVVPAPTNEKYSLTDKQVMEIETQTKILRLEREAEQARAELQKMRRDQYKKGT